MALNSPKKLLLSLSVAAALGCAGNAFADGDRVEELEGGRSAASNGPLLR